MVVERKSCSCASIYPIAGKKKRRRIVHFPLVPPINIYLAHKQDISVAITARLIHFIKLSESIFIPPRNVQCIDGYSQELRLRTGRIIARGVRSVVWRSLSIVRRPCVNYRCFRIHDSSRGRGNEGRILRRTQCRIILIINK